MPPRWQVRGNPSRPFERSRAAQSNAAARVLGKEGRGTVLGRAKASAARYWTVPTREQRRDRRLKTDVLMLFYGIEIVPPARGMAAPAASGATRQYRAPTP